MAAVAKTQQTVRTLTATAVLGVGIFVVYLLLASSTPKPRTFKDTLHPKKQPLHGPEAEVRSSSSDHSDRTHHSNSSNRNSTQKDSVRRFHWPSEASAKAKSRRPTHSTTPIEGCSDWIYKCASDCVEGEGTIPRTVFFVKVDDKFIFQEWLAVMSAVKIIKADTITIFSAKQMDPKSCWWKRTLPFVKHEIVPGKGWVSELNGKVVKELAHKSDFLRVEALYRLGGIYMDTDAIALKSFEPLLNNHNAVLAKQPGEVAACGLMLARTHSCFMCSFMKQSCRTFNGGWATHSIETLMHMQQQQFRPHRGVLLLEKLRGFYPIGWEDAELHKLYDIRMEDIPFSLNQAFALHLWNHVGSTTDYPKKLYDYSWLTKSPSVAAQALRRLLPQGFSEEHMNETICLDLPSDYV